MSPQIRFTKHMGMKQILDLCYQMATPNVGDGRILGEKIGPHYSRLKKTLGPH